MSKRIHGHDGGAPHTAMMAPVTLLSVQAAGGIVDATNGYTDDASPATDRDWPFSVDADVLNAVYGAGAWELRLIHTSKVTAGTGGLRLRTVTGAATMGSEESITATTQTAAVGAAVQTNLPTSGVARCRVQASAPAGETLTIESLRVEARQR